MMRVRVIIGAQSGGPYLATHFFGGTDLAGAQAASDAIAAFWTTVSVQLANTHTWATSSTVDLVDPVTGKTTAAQVVTTVNGTGGVSPANLAPVATQGLIRWHTNTFVDGKEVRGRTFIPSISTTRVATDGSPAGTLTGAMNSAAATLIAAAGSDLVVWSKKHGVAYSALSGSAWNKFAVLRSRRD